MPSRGQIQQQAGARSAQLRQATDSRDAICELRDSAAEIVDDVWSSDARFDVAAEVKRMAELLGENADEWIALAGRVPEDLYEIIQAEPTEIPQLLREARGLTAEQLRHLTEQARKLGERGR